MKRIIIAGAAGIAAVGAVTASAASLGGFAGQNVGADSDVVAACQGNVAIDISYVQEYVIDDSNYRVTDVVLSNVNNACDTLPYDLTLADQAGAPLVGGVSAGTISLTGSDDTIALDDSVLAEDIDNIALIISG